MKYLLCCVCFLFLSEHAMAGQQKGKVDRIIVRSSDGLHYFVMEGPLSEKPSCATNSYWMIKDEGSVAGKSQLAMLLSAQAQDKEVTVVGSNTCTRWSDGEDVDYIILD